MHNGKASAIAKFLNLIGTAIFVCPGRTLHVCNELCNKLHPYLQKKQNLLRRPISEIQVAYYDSVERAIGKLQIVLVFLEH